MTLGKGKEGVLIGGQLYGEAILYGEGSQLAAWSKVTPEALQQHWTADWKVFVGAPVTDSWDLDVASHKRERQRLVCSRV